MKFRPCIDLRNGRVVQIIGGTLNDADQNAAKVNFESDKSPADFARMYMADNLSGGHVISLGPGNTDSLLSALRAYPGGLQAGGGIDPENAFDYLDAGASHVIVTSYVFSGGKMNYDRLKKLSDKVGSKRLVLDLSCRISNNDFFVVTDRWQKFTDVKVTEETLSELSRYCDEYLVHGVDVEGKRQGMQKDLVELLGRYCPIPVTYAGGIGTLFELDLIKKLGQGRVDATIGSALDIFGGGIPYADAVQWHRNNI